MSKPLPFGPVSVCVVTAVPSSVPEIDSGDDTVGWPGRLAPIDRLVVPRAIPVRVPTLTRPSAWTLGLVVVGRPVVWLIGTPSRKNPAEFTRLPFLSTVNEPAR